MKIVPLTKNHLDRIDAQGAQDYVSEWMTPAIKHELASSHAFAAVQGDEVLGCGGIIEYWAGRATIWAILSGNCGRRFVGLHRAVDAFLRMQDYRRIEATADCKHGPASEWLEMLGFTLETPRMKGYLPNGNDAAMYVRGM